MNAYIGLTIGGLFVSLLQLGFTPSKPEPTAYQLELNVMLKSCIERGDNAADCRAIARVIQRARGAQ